MADADKADEKNRQPEILNRLNDLELKVNKMFTAGGYQLTNTTGAGSGRIAMSGADDVDSAGFIKIGSLWVPAFNRTR